MTALRVTPASLDFVLYRGDDFAATMTWRVDGVATAVPDTGWLAQIRLKRNRPVLAEFVIDASAGASGVLSVSLPASVTASLPSRSEYDMQVTSSGKTLTYFKGLVLMSGEVSVP